MEKWNLIHSSLKKLESMWAISGASADSLRHAGGTIVEVCYLQACLYVLVGT